MIKCSDIAKYIEELAPCNLACDWDNVGLLVGDMNKEIKKVLIALDNDEYITEEAVNLGADMIISHHPIMFNPVNRLTESEPQQRMLRRLCENGICHYAAHTNMDCALDGINDYLAAKIGLKNATVIEDNGSGAGFGRIARLEDEVTLADMIKSCVEGLDLDSVRYVGELDKKIRIVAVNGGSGSDIIGECIRRGADLLVTGDLKYTAARDAYERGFAVIDAGHYGTEIIFTEMMKQRLERKFPDIEFIISKANVSVIKNYCKD